MVSCSISGVSSQNCQLLIGRAASCRKHLHPGSCAQHPLQASRLILGKFINEYFGKAKQVLARHN
jgi:hypothetical protein